MLTIAGGEEVDWDTANAAGDGEPIPFWWAAPVSMLLAYALLIWRLWAEARRMRKREGALPASQETPEPAA